MFENTRKGICHYLGLYKYTKNIHPPVAMSPELQHASINIMWLCFDRQYELNLGKTSLACSQLYFPHFPSFPYSACILLYKTIRVKWLLLILLPIPSHTFTVTEKQAWDFFSIICSWIAISSSKAWVKI